MALSKKIELANGVVVSYHRVVSLTLITNVQIAVEVASYTDAAKRDEEKGAIASGEPMDVFVHTSYREMPYSESADVAEAYGFVKSLPEFEGSVDA